MKQAFYSTLAMLLAACAVTERGEIRVYSENRWYWEYNGEPVLLLGGSYEDNMFQFPNWYYGHNKEGLSAGMTDWTLEQHLDALVDAGGNYIRGSLSCRNYGNRFPYLKINGIPGDNYNETDIYDLNQWDPEWENRLDTFLRLCHERGIIVSIELFDRFDLFLAEADADAPGSRGSKNTGWLHHPWNPDRNINYTEETSGLPGGSIDYMGYDHELYYCVPGPVNSGKSPEPIVLETLQKYVDKVLSYTFQYDNIIYIIENETYQPLDFGNYWIDYINQKAAGANKSVFVTNMVGQPDPDHERQQFIRRDPMFKYYDYSQNNHNTGQTHYDNILMVKDDIAGTQNGIKPVNFVKIYGSAQYGSIQDAKERFWRGIFAGIASARFHRPGYNSYYWGLGLNEDARSQIKSVRLLTDKLDIFRCEPDNSLLGSRSDNEAYCLAEADQQYAVYFTDGGAVTLDLNGTSGEFLMQWLDIDRSQWDNAITISSGGSLTLTAPSHGQWVVLITKSQ